MQFWLGLAISRHVWHEDKCRESGSVHCRGVNEKMAVCHAMPCYVLLGHLSIVNNQLPNCLFGVFFQLPINTHWKIVFSRQCLLDMSDMKTGAGNVEWLRQGFLSGYSIPFRAKGLTTSQTDTDCTYADILRKCDHCSCIFLITYKNPTNKFLCVKQ